MIIISLISYEANDGHDTNMTFAGTWVRGFLQPLLADRRFNAERTLIVLSE